MAEIPVMRLPERCRMNLVLLNDALYRLRFGEEMQANASGGSQWIWYRSGRIVDRDVVMDGLNTGFPDYHCAGNSLRITEMQKHTLCTTKLGISYVVHACLNIFLSSFKAGYIRK
jgi:hypothetical protein